MSGKGSQRASNVSYIVQNGVTIPVRIAPGQTPIRAILLALDVGQSVQTNYTAVSDVGWIYRSLRPRRFTSRVIDGKVTVWRTE